MLSDAIAGSYLTLAPLKDGCVPEGFAIVNFSAGKSLIALLGSFKILSVSSPVFVTVVVNLRSPVRFTVVGPILKYDYY